MKSSFKQLSVHYLLSVLRGIVFLKQNIWSIFRFVGTPLLFIGRFLFKRMGIPIYRFVFLIRRQFARLYIPAKNRFLFIFTNRYIFHAAIVTVAAVTSVVNIQAGEVRAETFGSKSLLYGLINKDVSEMVEEISADQIVSLTPSNYSDIYAVSIEDTEIDLLYEEQISTTTGGSVIMAPTISEGGVGTAARGSTEEYIVQSGDVLGSIAERFGLNLNTLLWANNLNYRSTIKLGQALTIPPTDGVIYTVKNGDTVSSIAKKYGTTSDKILSFNNLSSSSALQIGASLMLPGATPPTSAPVRYTAPASSVFTGTRGASSFTTAAGTWLWPTDGCYITVYFHQYYRWGLHQGLDVDGDYTSDIIASRGGTITRAGWYDGYGNCIDIDHGDGYSTRYGHASKLFVSVGDTVNAGDVIGKVGTTGRSSGTHLHFEVNSGGTHLNPLNFIRCK